jgi:hypothetical protein
MNNDYSDIWTSTLGQTLDIGQSDSVISNGLSDEISRRYEEAAMLTDDEIWAKIQAGEL